MKQSMPSDQYGQLFTTSNEVEGFFAAFFKDELPDWNLVHDLGELFVRIGDRALGRAFLARSQRRLGDLAGARNELDICKSLVANGELESGDEEEFAHFLTEEDSIPNGERTRE